MAYKFTKGQQSFINSLASKTGLSPRVIGAWVFSEMNGGAARSREAAKNYNWLNIAYYDSGPGSITRDKTWRTPESAAQATADFLKGKRFGPSQGIRNILKTAGKSPESQMQAIANSGWASSGYEGGSTLRNIYSGLSGLPKVAPMSRQDVGGYPAPNTGSPDRRRLILDYFKQRGRPGALVSLVSNLRALDQSAVDSPLSAVPSGSPAVSGSPEPAALPSGSARQQGLSPLRELIYTPLGYGAKNGARTAPYAAANHYNHVHLAAGPRTVVRLGKRAQQMGLRVGENPAFDKVDPVHVPNSYHYKNQAIDVSGSPEKMMAFAKYVARLYGVDK